MNHMRNTMKRLIGVLAVVILAVGFAGAQGVAIGVKGLYFTPAEQSFKDIYGSGPAYGLEANFGLTKNLDLWIGADYYQKKGELTFSKMETDVRILPVTAGLRYRIPAGPVRFYAGAGLGYFLFREENLIGKVDVRKLGFLGKAGAYVRVFQGLYIDAHLRYSYCVIKPQDIKANIGGLSFGVGFGYDFGLGDVAPIPQWREVIEK
jgi:opacity protein-like surface antigen